MVGWRAKRVADDNRALRLNTIAIRLSGGGAVAWIAVTVIDVTELERR